jgi:hypothetical protein
MAGDPSGQTEGERRKERSIGPDAARDRLGDDAGRRLARSEDDAERLPAPELDEHGLAVGEVRQLGRDEVAVGPVAAGAGGVDRDLDVAAGRRGRTDDAERDCS